MMQKKQTGGKHIFAPAEFWLFLIGSIFAAFLLVELVLEIFFTLRPSARIFLVAATGLFYYLFACFYATRTGDLRPLRAVQIFVLVVYIACLLDITLLGKSVGRPHYSKEREDYIYWFVNLRPFQTIKNYIVGFQKGYFNFWWFSVNLLGNLCLLAPFSLLLPLLIRHQRRWYFFLPTILAISAAIEALQYLLMVGSCDVDDLILNFLGAASVFFLLKIPPLRKLIRKVTRSEF